MSALGRLRRSTRRAGATVSLEEFGRLFAGKQGPSSSGLSVTERRTLGLAAWWSGVRYLSESIAFLPTSTFVGIGGNRRKRSNPSWVSLPMSTPSGRPVLTWSMLRELWMLSLLHRGNAYGYKVRDAITRVVGMNYLHPDRVKARGQGSDGERHYSIDTSGRGTWIEATSREVFHIVGPGFDGIAGVSPIQYHADTLGIAVAADDFAGKYFANGAALSSYFKLTKARKKPIEDIKAELADTHRGITNAHEVGVLAMGVDYVAPALNAKDAQILEARQWSVLEIARILRLPPHKLYDLTRATFSNIEQQSIEAVTDGIVPWAERIEDQIDADPDLSIPGNKIELEIEGLLRGDSAARAAWYSSGIQHGYFELAEIRAREGLPPLPGMNVFFRPSASHIVDSRTGEVLIPAGAGAPGSTTAPPESASDSDEDDASSSSNGDASPRGGASNKQIASLIGGLRP